MAALLSSFLADEEGATAIEYALIVSLIAVVVLGAIVTLGDVNRSWYSKWSKEAVKALDEGG